MTEGKRTPKDIAILSGPTEDGQGARVVRIREGREGKDISAGEIRPVREGEPLNQSELVRLHPLDANKRVCAVEILHGPQGAARAQEAQEAQEAQKAHDAEPKRDRAAAANAGRREPTAGAGRPARVSNAKYRQNWSVIFGSKKSDSDWSLN